MTYLRIQIEGNKTAFAPGETVSGTASWQTDTPASIEVRLFWYTQGKGTRDVGFVNSSALQQPAREGSHRFEFVLPDGPYSFSGKLISLGWALEIVSQPSGESDHVDLVVSPAGSEVIIGAHEGTS